MSIVHTSLAPCPECKGPRTVEDLVESYQVLVEHEWVALCAECSEAMGIDLEVNDLGDEEEQFV